MQIEVREVTKNYRGKLALDHVSFTLDEPKIYGLLGRNGAGKTTFMNILAGHQLQTNGSVTIDGRNPFDHRDILKKICLIKEGDNFFKDVKVKQVLKTYQLFYPTWDQALADELIQTYKLPLNSRVKALSKGMASALGIIVGLASKAEMTIFDEPYIGIDAAGRQKFYDVLMEEYEEQPRTFIFSTHLIDEVSLLFEEVLILQNGKLVLQEDADVLRTQAYTVTGEADIVGGYIKNKRILKTKQLAGMMIAYVYGDRPERDMDGLAFEGIPIQDLMIYLTEQQKEVS
jgi:ABC-2 type transport system ATP-binding protein